MKKYKSKLERLSKNFKGNQQNLKELNIEEIKDRSINKNPKMK